MDLLCGSCWAVQANSANATTAPEGAILPQGMGPSGAETIP